jgi:16S rRNA processing protein RimM
LTENVPSPAPSSDPSDRIPAARLLRPQGRRGELLAEPLTDLPDLFAPGRRVTVVAAGTAAELETTIESLWSPTGRNAGRVVLKLNGIDSISAAELLAGRELLIPAAELPALEPDTWFVRDLLGCRLFDGDTLVGEITGVEYPMSADGRTRLPDAPPLLEVTPLFDSRSNPSDSPAAPGGHTEPALVPFLKSWLETVDLSQRRVVMRLPPGLVNFGEFGEETA